MNKRQRKKMLTRYREEEAKLLGSMYPFFAHPQTIMMYHWLEKHPRRHWLGPKQLQEKRAAYIAEMQREKEFIQEKSKTHSYTLGGWVKKHD